jgi:ribosomal protein S18 acetylase RimI-like enzyme
MALREKTIDVKNFRLALDVPGLIFRGFRGEEDYPHILTVINASKLADQVERSDTLEDITRNYAHLHNCDPYQDMVFAEVAGEVVGYGRVWWDINGDGDWLGFHLAFLHPNARRMGIGGAILSHNERRLRAIAEELISNGALDPAAPRYFEVWASDTEAGKAQMLTNEGYEAARYEFSMQQPLTGPVEVTPMPDGLEIRIVPPEHFRTVWDAMQEAFQDHWSFVAEGEEEYQKWLEWHGFNPGLWKVAWEGDQVAGMVLNFVDKNENIEYNRKRGYTEGICVRRPWRRRGLARALLTRSLQMFQEMGMDEAALGVDAQNLSGALNLYESCGFRVEKRHTTYRKAF